MKTNIQTPGLIKALLLGGCAAVATTYALETRTPSAHTAPNVTLDTQPLNRTGNLPASFSDIIKKVTPSVVKIEITGKAEPAMDFDGAQPQGDLDGIPGLRRFFEQRGKGERGRSQMPREHGAASGVIVTSDGFILTNNHVVDHADKVQVTLHDQRTYSARVVGTDPKSDLAVVKVDASGLPAITFADSSKVEVGDVVLAAGNPFGLGESVTLGMVSATGRASLGLDYEDFIQTDAAINPGNSGGALVDAQGRLIGINTAILSRGGGNDGVGFAIPASMACSVMDDLISTGKVNRAYLGVMIQDLSAPLASEFKAPAGTHGALVSDVPTRSPAAKAGLVSGDIITQIAGQPVTDARSLKLAVAAHKPGETTEFTALRDGVARTFAVALGAQPSSEKATLAKHSAESSNEGTLNGVSVADLSKAARREYEIPAQVQGAIVTGVEQDSPAWEAGMREGDIIEQINHEPVLSADKAVQMTEAPARTPTLVKVWSHGGSHYLTVDETKGTTTG